MKVCEVIKQFPVNPHNLTKQGTVKHSNVIGRTPTGELVYKNDIMGDEYPFVVNKSGTTFLVNPKTFELPDTYTEFGKRPPKWMVYDTDTNHMITTKDSQAEANNEVEQLRRWHGIDADWFKM